MKLETFEALKTLPMDDLGVLVEGETLKKCQEIILRIAEDVISLCESEGFWYQLGGGSALGAVRHGGYIQIGRAIDLNVLGRDFDALRRKVEEKLGDRYIFLDYRVPDYGLPMGKVMLKDSVFRDCESCESDNCGFFVDIIPLENAPDNPLLRKLHGALCMVSGGLLSCRKFYARRSFFLRLTEKNPELRAVVKTKIRIGRLLSFLPYATYAALTHWLYGLCKNDRSVYVTFPAGRKHYFGEMHRRTDIVPTRRMDFEGHSWPVPENYDAYLTRLYGADYMTPLPASEREHHFLLELKFPTDRKQL